ncbi:MAG: Uma2 family endonuclease [Aridibacter sp.]
MSSVSTDQTTISKVPFVTDSNGVEEIFYPTSDGKPMGETGIHIRLLLEIVQTLSTFYENDKETYVIGDILMYFVEGKPKKFVVPDVMVIKGIGNQERRSYKIWEEKKSPDVIFELSSLGTWHNDLYKKFDLYEELGVKEYYVFDPDYDYLPKPLIGYHLIKGKFENVAVENKRIYSPIMNLFLVDTNKTLRFFNPETNDFLPTRQELAYKTDELAKETKELATKTEELESENKRLKAELEKLKKQT